MESYSYLSFLPDFPLEKISKTFEELKNFDHTKPLPQSWIPLCTNVILLFIMFLLTVRSLRL